MAVPEQTPENGIELAGGIVLPRRALHFQYARSRGPGGQNVNKLNTKATLTVTGQTLARILPATALKRLEKCAGGRWNGDKLSITSENHRSQVANREECVEKLKQLLITAQKRPKKRKPTRPSAASVRKRLNTKHQRSQVKENRQQGSGMDGW